MLVLGHLFGMLSRSSLGHRLARRFCADYGMPISGQSKFVPCSNIKYSLNYSRRMQWAGLLGKVQPREPIDAPYIGLLHPSRRQAVVGQVLGTGR